MRRLPLLVVVAFALIGGLAPVTLAAPGRGPAVTSTSLGTIGSCVGTDACTGATGNIGNNSCIGTNACFSSSANIGDNSCTDFSSQCAYASGSIGHDSCNWSSATSSCEGSSANIGNNSCNGGYESCFHTTGTIGDNACNGYKACIFNRNIAAGTCNATLECVGVNRIVYVTVTGSGSKDGTSWANAYEGLGNALLDARTGDEFWVAAGTYLPNVDPLNPRLASFQLKEGTWAFGGFVGNETSKEQRDWVTNVTILSGDIGAPNDPTDNSNNLIFDADHATLDGFTITGGNATISTPYPEVVGGGILNTHDSTLRNLIITGNNAGQGGGIAIVGSEPAISNVLIRGNTAGSGGGIAILNGASPTLVSVAISGNSANAGGGIHSVDSSPTLTNVTISGNTATTSVGGLLYAGAFSSLTLRNSIIWNNGAGQLVSFDGATATVDHSDIQGGLPLGTTDNGGNLDVDPLFVSPVVSPAPTATGDLHLQQGSPAINAGANGAIPSGITTDIDGDARILRGTVDMGSDEVRTACTPGYYSATGDDRTGSCTPAALGYYVAGAGATSQTPAAVGYYVDHSGATSQTPCPAGQTTSSTASTSASACFTPYVSPYERKQHAVAELQALLPTGSAEADNNLTKAIANINASLASWRWLDADSLNPLHGFRVFNRERHGVTWLWTGVLLANPTWSAVANDAVNQLVAADREVVVTAIAESTDQAAIAAANAKLAQADALLAQHQRSKAIYKLRAAWLAVN